MTASAEKKLADMAREFRLSAGDHASPEDGLCAMEAVAFLDGGPHTDHPRAACAIISGYVRHINDNMPDNERQKLLPYLPRLMGTVSDELEQERHEYFAWQAARVFAPAALRAQGYMRFARLLENAETLDSVVRIADVIQRAIARKEAGELTPAQLAALRAGCAASAAMWFWSQRDDPLKGASAITPYTECAEAAAGAAFQAHRAGAAGVWDKVFEALDGVLSIGPPGREQAEVVSLNLTEVR